MKSRNVSPLRALNLKPWWMTVVLAIVAVACMGLRPQATGVKIEGKPGSYQLMRNGKPYFIKGAGGNGSRQLLLASGANSIRTWGAEGLGEVLDQAHRDGLTVIAGIWLGHRPGFDYGDTAAVRKQYEECERIVRQYKDHPALLMWSFGNEAEGDGKDPRVYKAIEEIAAMSKRVDPNHPTMTVLAEIGDNKLRSVHELCPSIDVVGINSYGGAPSLAERYAKEGGTKPYVVTEFGPLGQWEVGKTSWDAPIEVSSTEKEAMYRKGYEGAVASAKGTCLGSYVFLWGNKQEATATWFGMLLPDGTPLGTVDVMTEIWTGKAPKNRAPRIQSLTVEGAERFTMGATIQARLSASDPEGKPLKVKWVLSGEAVERLTAGQSERVPPVYPDAIVSSDLGSAQIKLPKKSGAFRVFAYVHDADGKAAVANVPILVSN